MLVGSSTKRPGLSRPGLSTAWLFLLLAPQAAAAGPAATREIWWVLALAVAASTAFVRWYRKTERQQVRGHEHLLREREQLIVELERKNAELERVIYTVSHDLKTPLVTIKGFLGLLRRDIAAGNAQRVGNDIDRISNATDQMSMMFEQLLELARLDHQVNRSQWVPLGELAAEAEKILGGRLAKRAVKITIAPDLPTVFGDRLRLFEVMQNLLENAIKYMGDQSSPEVEIGVRRDDAQQVVTIRDNGLGINPEYHQQVFRLFERLDSTTEGTGVGLALVKRIVEMHGGRIWVESQGLGHGSTFCFTLGERTGWRLQTGRSRSHSCSASALGGSKTCQN